MKIVTKLNIETVHTIRKEGGGGNKFKATVKASGVDHHVELRFDATSEIARALAAEDVHKNLRVSIEVVDDSLDPIVVLKHDDIKELKEILEGAASPKEKVFAVRDAMLTPRELEIVRGVTEDDDRTEDDFIEIARIINRILEASAYCAPEVFFRNVHAPIGQIALRQCEIDAINLAHLDGTF